MATSTSNFGAGRRESHDASGFYARFPLPVVSNDDAVAGVVELPGDGLFCGDSRRMPEVPDRSVALVVTSPPYFAGKAYEEEMGTGHIPGSYVEYLELLHDVFAECVRVLEPGGRIAVNVANLGRKPYRSLSADVARILESLGLLLRGEVVWKKADGAGGNCAWGSFRKPANPVLRDLTERIVIASKGRFDRAVPMDERAASGLPHEATLTNDEFMEATLDVWEIPPESARRVQHPAPFPVELPERLIHLYTYAGDLVLDPFLGSGSTVVAASRTGRRWAGYDMDPAYVDIARSRLAAEGAPAAVPDVQKAAGAVAIDVVTACGFTVEDTDVRVRGLPVRVPIVALSSDGRRWYFDVTGAFTTVRAGLARADVAWRAVGRAHAFAGAGCTPLVLLTSHLPKPRTEPHAALQTAMPSVVFDAIELLSDEGQGRLRRYAAGEA